MISDRIKSTSTVWWATMGVLLAAVGVALYHLTRGTTLWLDDWNWVLYRRGGSLDTLLRPYNEHFSLVPVVIYKLLFAAFGIGSWAPYRIVLIVAHLVCVAMVFAYARARVGPLLALLPAGVIALFGPGWQALLFPFLVAWLVALAAGLAALLALDRRDRHGEVGASVLLMISLASSGVGVAFAVAMIVEVVLTRRRWWIAALPVAVYAMWWIFYENAPISGHAIELTPQFVATGLAASVAGLAGLSGGFTPVSSDSGTLLTWGPPLLVALAILAGWRIARAGRLTPRAIALVVLLLGFWAGTGVERAESLAPAYSSRYVYTGAVLALLVTVELVRGSRVGWKAIALLALVTIAAILPNVDALRGAAAFERSEGQITKADLGALEIGRSLVGPGYVLREIPGYPLQVVNAGRYFAAAAELGTPAYNPSQIGSAAESARMAADLELISIHRVALAPAADTGSPGPCVIRTASSVAAPDAPSVQVTLPLPPGGALIRALRGNAAVAVRRFADQYEPVGTIASGASAMLRIGPDRAARGWDVQASSSGKVAICT